MTIVQDSSLMFYRSDATYTSTEALDVRTAADTGSNNQVSSAEAAAYLGGLLSPLLGKNATDMLWDGLPPRWSALNISAVDLTGQVDRRQLTFTYIGQLSLSSLDPFNHTLTLTRPFGVSNLSAEVYLPSNWSIDSFAGISPAFVGPAMIKGWITSAMAVITLHQVPATPSPPPPPPPPFIDTAPPVVNAGPDFSVEAGAPVALQGLAADNDPQFPQGAAFWWSFQYNGTLVNLSGLYTSFAFFSLGDFAITLSAMDGAGNIGTDTIHATVRSPASQLPTPDAGTDLTVTIGVPVTFTAATADNGTPFPPGTELLWSFDYNGSTSRLAEESFTFTFGIPGTYAVTLTASDPWGHETNDTRVVTVLPPDVTAPLVQVGQQRTVEAGVTTRFEASATDNDASFPQSASYWWTFTYEGTQFNISGSSFAFTFGTTGTYLLSFYATDAWGNTGSATLEVMVIPPDRQPPIVFPGFSYVKVTAGTTLPLDGDASDNDPDFPDGALFWWTFNETGVQTTLPGLHASHTFNVSGTYTITFYAKDRWDNIGSAQCMVVVEPRPAPLNSATNPPSAIAAAILSPEVLFNAALFAVAGAAIAGIAVYRRRHGAQAGASASGPAEGARAQAAPVRPPTARQVKSYVVEGLLLLHRDGRLISYQHSGSESHFDSPEVMGSMFTAVTEFIRDSFGKDGALSRLTYGQNTLVLQRSKHLFGAAIVYGEPTPQLSETLLDVLRRLESAYAGVVEQWSGDRGQFEGISGFLRPVFALTAGLTRADIRAAIEDRVVRLSSGTEHYKGYLRLRVALINQTDAKIRDARVTLLFNQSVLRLVRVEPAQFKSDGLTVQLADIAPGERVGVVYYLDPQTCSKTNIEGIATYFDERGGEHNVKMKPRLAEIVCPLFFTPEQANPGTMRRLVENSLSARDSKLYRVVRLPKGFDYGEIFNVAREAIQGRHVQLVRNIKEKSPFVGKAWFYGETKHSKSPVIIRISVSEERRMLEVFVAVESPATLSGLLAEFHRSLTELYARRAKDLRLEPVLDEAMKGLLSADEFGPEPKGSP